VCSSRRQCRRRGPVPRSGDSRQRCSSGDHETGCSGDICSGRRLCRCRGPVPRSGGSRQRCSSGDHETGCSGDICSGRRQCSRRGPVTRSGGSRQRCSSQPCGPWGSRPSRADEDGSHEAGRRGDICNSRRQCRSSGPVPRSGGSRQRCSRDDHETWSCGPVPRSGAQRCSSQPCGTWGSNPRWLSRADEGGGHETGRSRRLGGSRRRGWRRQCSGTSSAHRRPSRGGAQGTGGGRQW